MSRRHHPGIRVPLSAADKPTQEELQQVPPEPQPAPAMVRQGDVLLVPIDAIPDEAKLYPPATTVVSSSRTVRPPATPTRSRRRQPHSSTTTSSATCGSPPPRRFSTRSTPRSRSHPARTGSSSSANTSPPPSTRRVAPGDRLMAAKQPLSSPADLADRLRRYGAAQVSTAVTTELADRPARGVCASATSTEPTAAPSRGCYGSPRRTPVCRRPVPPPTLGTGSAVPTRGASRAAGPAGSGVPLPSRSTSIRRGAAGSSGAARRRSRRRSRPLARPRHGIRHH